MVESQLLGWLRRAYLETIRIRKVSNSSTNYSYLFDRVRDGVTPSGLRKNGQMEFAVDGGSKFVDLDDEDTIIEYFESLFGPPLVKFEKKQKPEEQPKPKEEEKVKEEEKPVPCKPEKKEFTLYNGKEEIIKEIRAKEIPALEEEKLAGGAIVIKAGEINGPVIYDYGISPDKGRRHIFIPYSSRDEVKNILNNFYKQTKTL